MDRVGLSNQKHGNLRTNFSQAGAIRLGCFGQVVFIVVLMVALGILYVALNPWAFFMGGNLHPLGYWRGWGRMQSKTAGDHFLYVEIYPNMRTRSTIVPGVPVTGKAWICRPKGEQFYLTLGGGMPFGYYVNTLGKPINLYMSKWQGSVVFKPDNRPSFKLYGHWDQRELIADDHKTLSAAFLPDGTFEAAGGERVSFGI